MDPLAAVRDPARGRRNLDALARHLGADRFAALSTTGSPAAIPNSAARRTRDATLAAWITLLLGRQAMFGHDPPTYRRSTTTTR